MRFWHHLGDLDLTAFSLAISFPTNVFSPGEPRVDIIRGGFKQVLTH